jgi:tetratricopeptide (TPR) repeat protein
MRWFERSCGVVLVAAALAGSGLSGCGAAVQDRRTLAERPVDDESYAEVRRRYLELAVDDPSRDIVRGHLLAHLSARTDAVLQAGDYDAIVSHLAEMTTLLASQDFTAGRALPPELRPLAEHVAVHGAQRGDEPRVLAAELILEVLDHDRASEHHAEYERVSSWGREARMPPTDDTMALVEGGMGLVSVWEEHARLTPSPEVLGRLAGLYLGLRDAIRGTTLVDGFRPPRSLGDMEHLQMAAVIMQRAPLEAAAVFLARGDLEGAIAQLASGGERGGDAWRVRRVLEDARGEDSRGAEALSQIANGFAEGRPDVAVGLCRQGLRRFPNDARFPLCLARVSSSLGRVGDTADYYVLALRLDASDLEVFDEALETFAAMISQGALAQSEDVGEVRTAGRAAHELIALRASRFPNAELGPLDQPTLHLALARAELVGGHAAEARREFEESIAEGRRMTHTPPAAIAARRELAELELRAGAPEAARALLTDALDLVSQGREGDEARASLYTGIGDTRRVAGEQEDSLRAYRQGLALLDGLGTTEQAEVGARRAIARGILLRRLGDRDRSRQAFEEAIALAPTPENAAEILQHLVTDSPDAELAERVFRRARVGSPISHAWKVYLALWVEAVHALSEVPASEEGSRVLAAEAARGGWQARLASLARGEIDETAALAAAEGSSERCEAHFYAAIRSLRAGDRAGARRALEASIETGMIGQGEFGMAQELLRSTVR